MGVRSFGRTLEESFEQAGIAVTGMITDPAHVKALEAVPISCSAPDPDFLFMDWLNSIIYEISTRNMLFSRFEVKINRIKSNGTSLNTALPNSDHLSLTAKIWGEAVDSARHTPIVEPKAATFTELKVLHLDEHEVQVWLAQCVIDV